MPVALMQVAASPLLILVGALAAAVLVFLLTVNVVKVVAAIFDHVLSFVGGMLGDGLRMAGSAITGALFVPLILLNLVLGRWSAATHYGRALETEVVAFGRCLGRLAILHPARLLGLGALTEGMEKRLPAAMAKAPGADKPDRGGHGEFEGYRVVGSLPTGGSGARLFIADPTEEKRSAYRKAGHEQVDQVVIKSFALQDEGALPNIVRENRALEAARSLGLVLDHGLNEKRFYYVMPYVPGEDLGTTASRLHALSGGGGLATPQLRQALGYVADLLDALKRYHDHGLWHKDIKPENIIISQGRAHVVDLGLVTPLRSAMTLTTHGTEYFRDPELVRQAMRGAKVNEVDGVLFDLYGVGAVLYSVIEDSFPAHGSLSTVTKRCPEALKWVVRRAMADLNSRYASAGQMLLDVRKVMLAPDPFRLKPADLPSMGGEAVAEAAVLQGPRPAPEAAVAGGESVRHEFPGEGRLPVPGGSELPGAPVPPPVPHIRESLSATHARRRAERRAERLRQREARWSRRDSRRLARAEARHARRRHQARSSFGILVAALLLGLTTVGLLGFAATDVYRSAQPQTHGSVATVTEGVVREPALRDVEAWLDRGGARPQMVELDLSGAHGAEGGSTRVISGSGSTEVVAGAEPCTASRCPRGSVLVIDETRMGGEGTSKKHVTAVLDALDADGYRLRGTGSEDHELSAKARLEMGAVLPTSPEVGAALARWIRGTEEVDAVLLLFEGDDAKPRARTFGRQGGLSMTHLGHLLQDVRFREDSSPVSEGVLYGTTRG